ncbi:putative non-inhibitory serpin-10 [Miscanthus floridulus]|uniref:putative non-inhibitory serpin-10 n=1 Tax=Miscanthus floridulus TaxID=154761 RepID=UPI003459076C
MVAIARLLTNVSTWPQLSFAAGIFVDRTLFLSPEFVSSAVSAHHAVARSVDLKNQTAAATAEVSAFIERATAGGIRNLLSDGAVHRDTKVVLANGMHFKATWARRFDPSDTVRGNFYRRDGEPVRVPFLSDAGMKYAESFDAPARTRLDSKAPCFCMLIFLPHRRDGLPDLLRLAVTQGEDDNVDIEFVDFPKFMVAMDVTFWN